MKEESGLALVSILMPTVGLRYKVDLALLLITVANVIIIYISVALVAFILVTLIALGTCVGISRTRTKTDRSESNTS